MPGLLMVLIIWLACLFLLYGTSHGQDGVGSEYYYSHWCAQHELTYLDDHECQKVFPSLSSGLDTDFQCSAGVQFLSREEEEDLLVKGYVPETSLDQLASIDSDSLEKIISSNVNFCMIVTKRVNNDKNKQHWKYYYS